MLEYCYGKNLNVQQRDALTHLRALEDQSQLVVSAFHLVEHLPFVTQQELIQQAMRVLKPAGLLILETPNPDNLLVATSEFYTDPTHQRPVPASLLQFLVQQSGFMRSIIVGLQEPQDIGSKKNICFYDVLHAVSPDYGIIAQKNSLDQYVQRFDKLFETSAGTTLAQLSERYDQAIHGRMDYIDNIHKQTTHALSAELEFQARQFQQLQSHMQHEMHQVYAELTRQQAQTYQLAQTMEAVFNSRSWRITQPLRTLASYLRNMRTGIQRLRHNLSIGKIAHKLQQYPRLARFCTKVITIAPPLENYLRRKYTTYRNPGNFQAALQAVSELGPHACEIYRQLQRVAKQRKIGDT